MTKKLVNFRLIFVCFAFVVLNIILIYSIYANGFTTLNIIGLVFFSLILISILIFIILAFTIKLSTFKIINFVNAHKFHFIILIVVILVSTLSAGLKVYSFSKMENFYGNYAISGKISNEITVKDNYTKVTLTNVLVTDGNTTSQLSSNLNLFIYGISENSDDVKVGNKIYYVGSVRKSEFALNGYALNDYFNNVIYTSSITIGKVAFETGNATIREKLKSNVKSILLNNMNEENASIAYSVLFGSKSLMAEETFNIFSYSGLAHILAVSGLHIGFLVAMLSLILKKLKVNKYVNFGVISVILFFYSYLCGFTPSVVRASIMSIVLLLANLFGEQYDSLNSLSIAGIIILVLNPTSLFHVGFQLSFMSVFGIITLAPYLNKLFYKMRFPKFVSNSLAISIATNLAILPITAKYFHQFSVISVLSNVIVLPLFSVVYSVLFLFTIFAMIPQIGFILKIPDLLLHAVKYIANLFASIPFSVVRVFRMGSLALMLMIIIALIIKFVMLNVKIKAILCTILTLMFLTVVVISNLSTVYNTYSFNTFSQNDHLYGMLTTSNNTKILVGSGDENKLDEFLIDKKVRNVDYLITYDVNAKNTKKLLQICKNYKITNVYILNSNANNNDVIKENFNSIKNLYLVNETKAFYVENYKFKCVMNLDKLLGIEISFNEHNLLLLNDFVSKKDLIALSYEVSNSFNLIAFSNLNVNLNEIGINYNDLCYFQVYPYDLNNKYVKNNTSFTYSM